MPHEPEVRAWLSRSRVPDDQIDDVVQEAYCRLAALERIDMIDRPGAYFFSIARNLLLAQIRRQRIVSIESVAEIEAMAPFDDAPSAERALDGKLELARVRAVLATLPERCRRIFEMRKIDGVPQKEIAARLGVNEGIVENESRKGLLLILAALKRSDSDAERGFERNARGRIG
ncbi:RNA polymerase sigma factor [Sphingosinicella terrae]|uniref:RNA polymerase sigma factor n=1 Tax=Sphingosinicella terrae TaxID=2172047 RepID=UPI000E0D58CC|nr:sigma-70 family RNA polymerase sigma factor [Sphingosinicella terrae]